MLAKLRLAQPSSEKPFHISLVGNGRRQGCHQAYTRYWKEGLTSFPSIAKKDPNLLDTYDH